MPIASEACNITFLAGLIVNVIKFVPLAPEVSERPRYFWRCVHTESRFRVAHVSYRAVPYTLVIVHPKVPLGANHALIGWVLTHDA